MGGGILQRGKGESGVNEADRPTSSLSVFAFRRGDTPTKSTVKVNFTIALCEITEWRRVIILASCKKYQFL